MATENEKTVKIWLDSLLAYHTDWEEFICTPFVEDDGQTFGLDCGSKNGALYKAYFLVEKLADGGLFDSGRQPRGDLDTAFYELGSRGEIPIFEEAVLSLRAGEDGEPGRIFLTIKTDKNMNGIEAAFIGAQTSAQKEAAAKAERERKEHEDFMADAAKELRAPVFSEEEDFAFVTAYLTGTVNRDIPGAGATVAETESADKYHYQEKTGFCRKQLTVTFNDEVASNEQYNAVREKFDKIFRGCAASMFMQERAIVTGNYARLAAEIIEHDPKGAVQAMQDIGLSKFPQIVRDNCDLSSFTMVRVRSGSRNKLRPKK